MSDRIKAVPKPSKDSSLELKKAYLEVVTAVRHFEEAKANLQEANHLARLKATAAKRKYDKYIAQSGIETEPPPDFVI